MPLVDVPNHGAHIAGGEVSLTGHESIERIGPLDVLHVPKPLGLEEVFRGDILGRKTDGGTLPDPKRARLGRRLGRD